MELRRAANEELRSLKGLRSIKQPQVFGTQYSNQDDQPYTQEPYDRDLLSDALRAQFCVPPVEIQKDNLKYYDKGGYPPQRDVPGCSGNH